MLKWAYNPQLRAKSVPVAVNVSVAEDIEIQLNDVKEDTRYLTQSKSIKKKFKKRSLTVNYTSGRRNSFSIVKQGLKAITLKKNLSNSSLNINEADDEQEEEEEDKTKETKEETKKATITDIAKCHFSRVFEPNSGG